MARRSRTRKGFVHLNLDGWIKIAPKLAEEATKGTRIIKPALEKIKKRILENAEKRFLTEFKGVGSSKGVNVVQAMWDSSGTRYTKKRAVVEIARKPDMDKATRLPPTKAEGNVYNLWSLLREGWGRLGGKRPDDYVLMVYTNTGVVPPDPSLVSSIESSYRVGPGDRYILNGKFHMLIRHPGFKGRDWLTVMGKPWRQDLEEFNRGIKNIAKRIGKSFTKRKFLRVG